MMKATATINGRKTVVVGLSHANLDRLRADGLRCYILIDGAAIGVPFDIRITAAETEREMLDAFAPGIDANTVLHIDPKLKS